MPRTLTLGDPKRGILLGNLRLKIAEKFDVIPLGMRRVLLKNHADEFMLFSPDGEKVWIKLWDTWHLFHPFLQIEWLKRMLGLRASPNFGE